MKQFVKYFYSWYNDPSIEDMIKNYAKENKLKIITIIERYKNGIYVVFEKGGMQK